MIEGQGLHSGKPSRIAFERIDAAAPITFVQEARSATLEELAVVDATRSTSIGNAVGVRIATVEHVCAALAGLGLHRGVRVRLEGDEIPLVDGRAIVFTDALAALGVAPTPPSLVVKRREEIVVGEGRYLFSPQDTVALEVHVDFDDVRIAKHAEWEGEPRAFREEIAVARTFGFSHEVDELAARGLASHVAPDSVIVFTEDDVLCAGRAYERDEPARHKLLDFMGDLFVHGGPPIGRVVAHRPGHGATHEAIAKALAIGVVSRAH